MKPKLLLIALLICGVAYASTCSYDAYMNACHYCPVDKFGKMNQTCSDSYQQHGQTCIAMDYPILASNYKAGNCSQVDKCASELEACKHTYGTGNDTTDCKNFMVESCFKDADQCIDKAAQECGGGLNVSDYMDEIRQYCPWVVILSIVLVGAVYAEQRK